MAAFRGCRSFKSDISKWVVSRVTTMQRSTLPLNDLSLSLVLGLTLTMTLGLVMNRSKLVICVCES